MIIKRENRIVVYLNHQQLNLKDIYNVYPIPNKIYQYMLINELVS